MYDETILEGCLILWAIFGWGFLIYVVFRGLLWLESGVWVMESFNSWNSVKKKPNLFKQFYLLNNMFSDT